MTKLIKKLGKIVEKNPNKTAYKVNNQSISYEDLWDKACHYGDLLKREGNGPIIIYDTKSIDVIVAIFACLIANRPYVNVDITMPLERLNKIIDITKSTLIITKQKINNICYSLKDLENLKTKTLFDNNNIAYIIFTSGSTGVPKGVPISYENLDNFTEWISNFNPLSCYKNMNVLNQASFSFDLSVADMFYSFCNGHTLISLSNIDDFNYSSFIRKNDINIMFVTPTFIKLCLLDDDFNSVNCPSLKCIYFCGEQLDKDVVEKVLNRFENLCVINAYGPTEATSAVSAIVIDKNIIDTNELLPVGKVGNFATDIEIINNEIILKGKSVFSGYINGLNDSCYIENEDNCFKTGDIGFIDKNMLYCKGRMYGLIKYKGYRIELSDIEFNIKSIDNVKDCVVLPIYSNNNNNVVKSLKAFVLTDYNFVTKDIKDKLKLILPEYMIPKTFVFLKEFPINSNYKVDRKALMKIDKCM